MNRNPVLCAGCGAPVPRVVTLDVGQKKMSDDLVVLIRDSPTYVPSREAQQRALALFREFTADADESRAEEFASIQFVECGGNFESVTCPDCGRELDQGWFGEAMSEDYKEGFLLSPIVL